MDSKSLATYFLLILIAAALVLAAQILMPFLAPLSLAAAFAVVLNPFYQRLQRAFRGHDNWAAFATLVAVALCVLVPLSYVALLVGREATKLYLSLVVGSFAETALILIHQVQHSFPQDFFGSNFSETLVGSLSAYGREALGWLTGHATVAFSSIAALLLDLFIFFIALFFFLRDGESLRRSIIDLSPLADKDDELIFERLGMSINSVIRGNLLVALIRGIFAAIGFFFFSVPNPALWGIIAGLAGLIPGIGIVLVFAPAILYDLVANGWVAALGLLLWGVFVVGLIDNVLAPRLMGHGTQLHPLFVLLSVFGGIAYFGPVGIFLGPLSLSLLFALLSIYAAPGQVKSR